MKHLLQGFPMLVAAVLLGGALLPAAEVTVVAPDSPVLRFALGKLESCLRQQGDRLRLLASPAPGQTAMLSVTTDPVVADGSGPDARPAARAPGRVRAPRSGGLESYEHQSRGPVWQRGATESRTK